LQTNEDTPHETARKIQIVLCDEYERTSLNWNQFLALNSMACSSAPVGYTELMTVHEYYS